MKFLYVSFVSRTKQYSGILKKVAGQTDGAARLGWKADYISLGGSEVILKQTGGDEQKKALPPGLRWRAQQRAVTERICEFTAEGAYDAVYIKGFLATPYALKIAASAKRARPSCRVIYEVATYPYWGEYRRYFRVDLAKHDARSFAGHLLEAYQHITAAPRMKRYVDAVVVFGEPAEELWGIPALTIDNGVSTGAIALRTPEKRPPESEIRLLGVAGTSVAHGYERILAGMAEYQKKKAPESPDVCFDLVGENETIQALRKKTADYGLETKVQFLGYKNAAELAELYNRCDAAVSSLGVYRIGLKWLSPLKSREYCAAGVPFLYAYEDTIPEDAPFALKIPNSPAPVNMEDVVKFVRNCRIHPEVTAEERRYAEKHFDWRSIMERVLLFAGAAEKSV